MTPKNTYSWLVLIYYLPPEAGSARVRVWRKMKKLGMVAFRNSVYFLPYGEEHYEILQWLCQEIQKAGGEATLLKVEQVENLSDEEVARFFMNARAEDYEELAREARNLLRRLDAPAAARTSGGSIVGAAGMTGLEDELKAMSKKLADIGEIDFFQAPGRLDAEEALGRCRLTLRLLHQQEEPAAGARGPQLSIADHQGKTWVTRPRPHVDRIATAWAITRFIDEGAVFDFAEEPKKSKGAVAFDYVGAELSHQGDDCTLETLIVRFRLEDARLRAVAEIVHDADLKDGKYSRPEAAGLDAILRGLAATEPSDRDLLRQGISIMDALYSGLKAEVTQTSSRRSKNATT